MLGEGDAGTIGGLMQWLLTQDPLATLVLVLVLASELRTRAALSALKMLDSEYTSKQPDPKKPLS